MTNLARIASVVASVLVAAACSRTATVSPAAAPAEPVTTVAAALQGDVLATSAGEVRIVPVHHGTLRLEIDGAVVWIDPWSKGSLEGPKADYVLLTDIHADHYDAEALAAVKKEGTVVVAPAVVAEKEPGAIVLANGGSRDFGKFSVSAVPMYNLERGPEQGKLFHDKGRGNGYLITVGEKNIYVSGDTECTEEMKALQNVDVAFVSMNLPYTMPPSEAAVCIRAFRPKAIYPYHYGDSDLAVLRSALDGEQGIELRLRNWY